VAAAARLDLAADGGVYENEPEVRTDVVRSDDFEPDAVERGTTRNLVNSWKNRQQQQPTKQVNERRYNQQFFVLWGLVNVTVRTLDLRSRGR